VERRSIADCERGDATFYPGCLHLKQQLSCFPVRPGKTIEPGWLRRPSRDPTGLPSNSEKLVPPPPPRCDQSGDRTASEPKAGALAIYRQRCAIEQGMEMNDE